MRGTLRRLQAAFRQLIGGRSSGELGGGATDLMPTVMTMQAYQRAYLLERRAALQDEETLEQPELASATSMADLEELLSWPRDERSSATIGPPQEEDFDPFADVDELLDWPGEDGPSLEEAPQEDAFDSCGDDDDDLLAGL
jgi:hypothetical protein